MVEVGWCGVVLALSALISQATAQTAEPSLNVTVRDNRGRVIRGLEAPDFAVTEDSAAATVRSVRFVESGKDPVHLTLLFDYMAGEPARLSRDAALELLSAAGPNVDLSIWIVDQKLSSLQAATTDRKILKPAIDAATGKKAPATTPDSSEVAQAALRGSAQLLRESRFRPSIAALIAIARAQQEVPGRRAIVYFSEGLPLAAGEESLLNAISAANRAGMGVYVIDASGLAISKEEESARQMAMNYRLTTSRQTLNQEDSQGIYGSGRGVTGDRGVAVGNLEARPIYQPSAIAQLAAKTGAFVIGQSGEFRSSVRRLVEDLSSYYVVTYARPGSALDGRFHEVRVSVRRDKAKAGAGEGYYAAAEGPGGLPLAFQTPLLELLPRAPVRDFPVAVETVQFRGEQPGRPLVTLLIEVPGSNLQFDEDSAAGFHRAHLSILAVVRDAAGKIVERFGRDMPVQTPPRMLDDMRKRRFLFQDQANLAPGDYTLETAVQDRLSGRVNVLKSPFTVAASAAPPAIEGLSLVHHVVAAGDAKSDGAFSLAGKTIVPAVDRVIQGGKGASATFFFRLHPATPAPVLAFEFLHDGKSLVRRPLAAQPGDTAQVVTLDISTIPSGTYDFRILATQGTSETSATTRITIENGAVPDSGTPAETETEVEIGPATTLPSAAPNAGQQRLLEDARASGLHYAAHLPNFVCTEVTRRLLDPAGKQEWRNLDESAQLVSYYDGKEHYESLTTRNRSAESDRYPPSLTSTGEFGSLLKSIFAPESAAQFAWVRADSLRGNAVQVFSYAVDTAHSQYRVSHQVAGQPKAVFSGFHGLLYINQETAIVLRLTLESDQLPPDFPVRQMAVSLDYGDTEVGGQVYTLPLSFSVDVRLRKRTQIRNESVFRSYQRFTSTSRIVQ